MGGSVRERAKIVQMNLAVRQCFLECFDAQVTDLCASEKQHFEIRQLVQVKQTRIAHLRFTEVETASLDNPLK